MQSTTTGETLCENVIVRQLALATNRLLAGDDPALDMINTNDDSEMKRKAEHQKGHRMGKVHDCLEMW
jgi:hypothetical protein